MYTAFSSRAFDEAPSTVPSFTVMPATPSPQSPTSWTGTPPHTTRRPARANATDVQATNSVLKEKLSPQNAIMPIPFAGVYTSFGQPHMHTQAGLPHASTAMASMMPPYAQLPHGAVGGGVSPQIFFTPPHSQSQTGVSQGYLMPAVPGSSLMFAPSNPCAAESRLQQEIMMSFVASQHAASQRAATQRIPQPLLPAHHVVGGAPAGASTPFLLATPPRMWSSPAQQQQHQHQHQQGSLAQLPSVLAFPQSPPTTNIPSAPNAAQLSPASGPSRAPSFNVFPLSSRVQGVSEERRAQPLLSPQPQSQQQQQQQQQQPPMYVLCGNPTSATTTAAPLLTLFSNGVNNSAAGFGTPASTVLGEGQLQQQQHMMQSTSQFNASAASSLTGPVQAHSFPMNRLHQVPSTHAMPLPHPVSASITPSVGSASASVTTPSTTAIASRNNNNNATIASVEEGKSFEEDPVPIDTAKCQLIVNFLSQKITNEEFRSLFRQYGDLFEHASHIIYDFRHGKAHHHASMASAMTSTTTTNSTGAAAATECDGTNPLNGTPASTLKVAEASAQPVVNARSKGYGFVYYRDGISTAAAMRELNGKELHGRRIKVRYAEQQRCIEDLLLEEEKALLEESVTHMLQDDDDL